MAGIRRSATGTRTSGRALELTAFYSFVRRARCGARLAAVSADSASQFSFFHALFTSARLSHEPTEAVLADLSRDRLSNTTTETREDSMDQPGPRRTASSDFLCSPPRAEDQTSRVTWSPAELEALLQDVEDGSEAFRSRATTKSFVALTTRPLPGQSEDVAVRDDDDAECSCLTGLALREASLPCSVGTLTIGERRLAEGGSRLFAVIRGAESPSFSPGKVRKALASDRSRHRSLLSTLDAYRNRAANEIVAVTEHADGVTLDKILAARSIPPAAMIRIVVDLLQAVHALHTSGGGQPYHHDIRPEHILVGFDGTARLFGHRFRTIFAPRSADAIIHIAGYSAPEQLASEPADHRADIFSLGIVMWESVAGKKLFHGPSLMDTYFNVIAQMAPRLNSINPALPPELAAACSRLLAKRPSERPASARAVAKELLLIAEETGLLSSHDDVAQLAFSAAPHRKRRAATLSEAPEVPAPTVKTARPLTRETARRRFASRLLLAFGMVTLFVTVMIWAARGPEIRQSVSNAVRGALSSGR